MVDVRTGDPTLAAWAGRAASPDAGGSAPRGGKGKRGGPATRGAAGEIAGAGREPRHSPCGRFSVVQAAEATGTDGASRDGFRAAARDDPARCGHRSFNEYSGAVVSTFAPGASAIWMWEQLVEDTELRRHGHPVSSLGLRRGMRLSPGVPATMLHRNRRIGIRETSVSGANCMVVVAESQLTRREMRAFVRQSKPEFPRRS